MYTLYGLKITAGYRKYLCVLIAVVTVCTACRKETAAEIVMGKATLVAAETVSSNSEAEIFSTEFKKEVRNNIEKLQQNNKYSVAAPLFIFNPYQDTEGILYGCFGNESAPSVIRTAIEDIYGNIRYTTFYHEINKSIMEGIIPGVFEETLKSITMEFEGIVIKYDFQPASDPSVADGGNTTEVIYEADREITTEETYGAEIIMYTDEEGNDYSEYIAPGYICGFDMKNSKYVFFDKEGRYTAGIYTADSVDGDFIINAGNGIIYENSKDNIMYIKNTGELLWNIDMESEIECYNYNLGVLALMCSTEEAEEDEGVQKAETEVSVVTGDTEAVKDVKISEVAENEGQSTETGNTEVIKDTKMTELKEKERKSAEDERTGNMTLYAAKVSTEGVMLGKISDFSDDARLKYVRKIFGNMPGKAICLCDEHTVMLYGDEAHIISIKQAKDRAIARWQVVLNDNMKAGDGSDIRYDIISGLKIVNDIRFNTPDIQLTQYEDMRLLDMVNVNNQYKQYISMLVIVDNIYLKLITAYCDNINKELVITKEQNIMQTETGIKRAGIYGKNIILYFEDGTITEYSQDGVKLCSIKLPEGIIFNGKINMSRVFD